MAKLNEVLHELAGSVDVVHHNGVHGSGRHMAVDKD